MALAPYSRRRHDQDACNPNPAKVIAGEKGNGRKALAVMQSNGHGIGSHDGAGRCTEDRHKRQGQQSDITLPERPVLDCILELANGG